MSEAFEKWMKSYYIEHGVISSGAEMREAFRAGMKRAAEIVRTCAPPKAPHRGGPRWEIGEESRAAYAGAILAEADK